MIATISVRDIFVYTICAVGVGWGLGVYTCYKYNKKHENRV